MLHAFETNVIVIVGTLAISMLIAKIVGAFL